MRIFAQNAFVEGRFQPATISIADGLISSIELGRGIAKDLASADLNFEDGFLVPGLIDLQLNGVAGVDFSSADQSGIESALAALPVTGTTSCCPTVITSELDQIKNQLGVLNLLSSVSGSARSLGVHLEGPVISPDKKGAHSEQHIISGTAFLASGLDLSLVKILTLAPEVQGAKELIAEAKKTRTIVSLGHSNATSAEARQASQLGASMITHLFNAMRKIHQREPGIATSALLDESLSFGLIVDGEHVDYELVELALRLAGDRAFVVSDASAALLAPEGQKVKLGGTDLVASKDGAAKRNDGTIASSGMSQLQAIENAVQAGLSREKLIRSATIVPADLLGESKLGRLEVGALADIVHYQVQNQPSSAQSFAHAASPVVDLVLIKGEKCPL